MFWIVCDPSDHGTVHTHTHTHTHTHAHAHAHAGSKLRCQTPIKHTTNISEPLRISALYSLMMDHI